ncbi:DUF4124 domain-containing protein [Thiohalobacter sp. IOR34]|uniref:DUF4124 domain-containing protein n=1 Tax=Thiohalobacter sp. IOR34 TaxID=3057176 RepID=UPI0025B0DE84|nr:DUF4124 domain-containing protein [Thiohalobacter sp. IOR34]WJW76156.1 DUF4124 domain-containing protein [Thiohalobacter sp. IOR34]
MRHPTFRLSLALGLLLCALPTLAAMYKWVDAEGRTHYSQYPPRDREFQTLVPPPPPSSDAGRAQQRLEENLRRLEEAGEARRKAKAEAKADKAARQQRQENCKAARSNLVKLQAATGRRMVRGPDGVAYHMDEKERQARIAETRKQIEKYCD